MKTNNKTLFLFLLMCTLNQLMSKTIKIDFYSEEIIFNLETDNLPHLFQEKYFNNRTLKLFLEKLDNKKLYLVSNTLLDYKRDWLLNDWLFYELTTCLSSKISLNENETIFLTWYILNKSNFKVRLTYNTNKLFIEAFSNESSSDFRFINEKKGRWIILNSLNETKKQRGNVKIFDSFCKRKAHPFSFKIQKIPILPNQKLVEKQIKFQSDKDSIEVEFLLNETYVQILKDYPLVPLENYYSFPNTSNVIEELIAIMKFSTEHLSETDKVKRILSIVRLSIDFVEDKEFFNKEKPLIIEEVLYYQKGDCEDRSLFLFLLLQRTLDIPLIVIKYKDHVNIGVKLNDNYGTPIRFKGDSYTVLEPSDFLDNSNIGYNGKEGENFEIIYWSTAGGR